MATETVKFSRIKTELPEGVLKTWKVLSGEELLGFLAQPKETPRQWVFALTGGGEAQIVGETKLSAIARVREMIAMIGDHDPLQTAIEKALMDAGDAEGGELGAALIRLATGEAAPGSPTPPEPVTCEDEIKAKISQLEGEIAALGADPEWARKTGANRGMVTRLKAKLDALGAQEA